MAATGREIYRRSSIETEPRTLNLEQLRGAREAALFVLKTKPIDEAVHIFTEGLKPVLSVGDMKKLHSDSSEDSEELSNHHEGLDLHTRLRDILTAPF